MAMARRAYYARIRSQPSLRSCCSRVSVRETFSLTGVTCSVSYVGVYTYVKISPPTMLKHHRGNP